MCTDVEELGLIERVDQVCPELKPGSANKAYGLGHGKVPLVTAGQAERSDWRGSVLSCRRWHEGCRVEPEQTILIASRGVADLIGPQRTIDAPAIEIAIGDLNSSRRT